MNIFKFMLGAEHQDPEAGYAEIEKLWPIGFKFQLLGIEMIVTGHHTDLGEGFRIAGVTATYVNNAGNLSDRFFRDKTLGELLK